MFWDIDFISNFRGIDVNVYQIRTIIIVKIKDILIS